MIFIIYKFNLNYVLDAVTLDIVPLFRSLFPDNGVLLLIFANK